MTQEQKQAMLKSIKDAEPNAIFQHEVDALKVMYSKYLASFHDKSTGLAPTEPSQDEVSEDLKFLERITN